jgi:hypothetical protein
MCRAGGRQFSDLVGRSSRVTGHLLGKRRNFTRDADLLIFGQMVRAGSPLSVAVRSDP